MRDVRETLKGQGRSPASDGACKDVSMCCNGWWLGAGTMAVGASTHSGHPKRGLSYSSGHEHPQHDRAGGCQLFLIKI